MNRPALIWLALAALALAQACSASTHRVYVEPMGSYANELLPSAHLALAQGARLALPVEQVCDVEATVDAEEIGRAGSALRGDAPTRFSIEVEVEAWCGDEYWSSLVTHEVVSGPTPSARRSALSEGVDFACREASSQLRSGD